MYFIVIKLINLKEMLEYPSLSYHFKAIIKHYRRRDTT